MRRNDHRRRQSLISPMCANPSVVATRLSKVIQVGRGPVILTQENALRLARFGHPPSPEILALCPRERCIEILPSDHIRLENEPNLPVILLAPILFRTL